MYVKQLFTGCLSEMTYYIESNEEAVIIDPLRETTPYLDLANQRKTKIKYIFLTHFHADFVSGHIDLANKTGATIVFGPNAKTEFEFYQGADNEKFNIGDIQLQLLHTPGHTMESSCYLLIDHKGKTPYIFTGDTLFIGDVGRPDLAVKSTLTKEDLAGLLFNSLREKIMPLSDDTIVYPAHGAGSACGKNMSKETFDTLGNQKKTNYALNTSLTKEDFIKEVTNGLASPPQYFPKNVLMNQRINKDYDAILNDGFTPLGISLFKNILLNQNALIIDSRNQQDFVKAHIPGALFFGLNGQFAPWVGTLITDLNIPLLLVTPAGKEKETITRLARVGYDNVKGFLNGEITAWEKAGEEIATIPSISPSELAQKIDNSNIALLDVRKVSEYATEHVDHQNLIHLSLSEIHTLHKQLNKNETYHIYCAGGYRSVIAASILKKNGFNNLINISGGFGEIKKSETIKTVAQDLATEI